MAKIQDYAVIGNGRSVALISNECSIDWLCLPKFDSPALFSGILDDEKGGSWKISPITFNKVERSYIEDTNVLTTRFITETGQITVTDFMPVTNEDEKQESFYPEHELIRHVTCERGKVKIGIHFDPRPNYGQDKANIKDANALGLRMTIGRSLVSLRSSIKESQITLQAGQSIDQSLTWTVEGPAVLPPLGDLVSRKLQQTIQWWQTWARQSSYEGPYKQAVKRSALVLKLLGYAPSGSYVAAPTTSLPDRIGGDLNWDYRYSWLRDAAFTARGLFALGYKDEGNAFVSWLLHTTRLTRPRLRVMYDVFGKDMENDTILPHLKGYANSYPVRIGNGVRQMFEMDIYGEVVDAVVHFVNEGGELDNETKRWIIQIGKYICKNWQKPDSGIWEKMPWRRFTHSRLMCWVALDRLTQLFGDKDFKSTCELIRKEIEEKCWNEELQSYVKSIEENELDAALLLMPLHGFLDPTSPRMRQTYQKILERLTAGKGLLYRYEKSTEEGEGAFGLCGFWKAQFLAEGGGTIEDAKQAFEESMLYANDVGLFSEEIDPKTGDALGNFPQMFTHIGVINAALSIQKRGIT